MEKEKGTERLWEERLKAKRALMRKYCHGALASVDGGGQGGVFLRYRDFTNGRDKMFRWQDYCWEDQAYGLLSRYMPSLAPLLDVEFQTTFDLTYNNFCGLQRENTVQFRRAVWYYVHRVYGISNDDYDYSEVNKFVNRKIKSFVKSTVCDPMRIGTGDWQFFSTELQLQEKIHVVLLATEALRQALVVYSLYAVSMQMKR